MKKVRKIENSIKKPLAIGLIILAIFTAFMLILGFSLFAKTIQWEINQPSAITVKANKNIMYESAILTEVAKEEARNGVEPSFKIAREALTAIEQETSSFFTIVKNINAQTNLSQDEKVELLQRDLSEYNNKLQIITSTTKLVRLTEFTSNRLVAIESKLQEILKISLQTGVQEIALENVRNSIIAEIELLDYTDDEKYVLKDLVQNLQLRGTLVFDVLLTTERKEQAADAVVPVRVTIKQNEKIIGEGDIITAEALEKLETLGLTQDDSSSNVFYGFLLFTVGIFIITIFYIGRYRRSFMSNPNHIILYGLLTLIYLLLIVITYKFSAANALTDNIGYIIPVAFVPMMVSVLLDNRLAIYLNIVMALYAGIIMDFTLQLPIFIFVSGLVGVLSVSSLSQRGDLMKSTLYVFLANSFVIISTSLIQRTAGSDMLWLVFFGLLGALLSTVLTIGFLPFFESVFKITTNVRLLELSNPNTPLLKRLMFEAPGTYHHSIMVGNLASSAAHSIHANSLLVRVGAYYHDIGKLRRPFFFIENQIYEQDNPHENLTPNLSKLVILSHAKDGLDLAKEYKLPKDITDFILQHHGTSLVRFFYSKALDTLEGVKEDDYRYEGPKPHTKEAAILMLADSVEAGVRSLNSPAPGVMEGFIRKIIKEKLDDGQLEESELTFHELDVIAQSFVRVMAGLYHSRVEYPELVIKELERSKEKEDANRS
ncbi:MAG: HDIG domain-containing metalloprotein [Clostridia bacterium]